MANDYEAAERIWNNYAGFLKKIDTHRCRAEKLQKDIEALMTNLNKYIKSFVLNITQMAEEVTDNYHILMECQEVFQHRATKKKREAKEHHNNPNPPDDLSHVPNNVTPIKSNDTTPLTSLKEKRNHRKRTSKTLDYSEVQNFEEFNVAEPSPSKKAIVVLDDVIISKSHSKNDNTKTYAKLENKKDSKSNKKNKSLSYIKKEMERSNLFDTSGSSRDLRWRKQEQSKSNADDSICRKSPRISAHPPGYFQTKPRAVIFMECSSDEMETLLTKQNSYVASSSDQLVGGTKKVLLQKEVIKVINSDTEDVENTKMPINKNKEKEPDGDKTTGRRRLGG